MLNRGQKSFFKKIQAFLEKKKEQLFWWELTSVRRNNLQSLYESDFQETLVAHQKRSVEEESFSLEILVPMQKDGVIGHFTADLDCYTPLDKQLSLMLELAKNNSNPIWYPVESSQTPFPSVITFDLQILENAHNVLKSIENQMNGFHSKLYSQGVHMNTAEIYVNHSSIQSLSQTGVFRKKDLSSIYFELAMEQTPNHQNQEINNFFTSVSYDDSQLETFFQKSIQETINLGKTHLPETGDEVAVLVDDEAISSFMSAIRSQLNCANEYYRFPFLKVGDSFSYEGDSLNLSLNPFLEGMADSTPFTHEGLPAKEEQMIFEGTIQHQIIGNRFGQYLKKTPNRITGNMIVKTGSLEMDRLRFFKKNVIEVVKFSSLLVDDHQMTWSSEIKLAKQYCPDGSIKLIKGGVMSGNIRENLKHCYFSKESSVVNFPGTGFSQKKGYIGPRGMLILSGISVVGL